MNAAIVVIAGAQGTRGRRVVRALARNGVDVRPVAAGAGASVLDLSGLPDAGRGNAVFVLLRSREMSEAEVTAMMDRARQAGFARCVECRPLDPSRVSAPSTHEVVQVPQRVGDVDSVIAAFADAVARAVVPSVSAGRLADYLIRGEGGTGFVDGSVLVADASDGNPLFGATKRVFDIVMALALLVFLSWLLVLVGVLVRLDSPGPALFRQVRIGRHGRAFTCYKFRSMHLATPERGTHEVGKSAVTRIGAVLRRTKLDELPQVINILRNEMSLIGPRPCLPVQTALIEERRARGVFELMPGITGLAQINGIDMSDPETLAIWDARYGALRCWSLDVSIALGTVAGDGGGDHTRDNG